jgi:anaerobic magnesium-protoporphyrin IX monomethyl ester cyclase
MKRMILINPPSPFLIDERVFPNLGLVQLATSLKEKGVDAPILDLCGTDNAEEKMRKAANDYDLFGFSSTTPQFIETAKLNRVLKETNTAAKSIIGGAHPSAIYSLVKSGKTDDPNIASLGEFDFYVSGEGDDLDLDNLQQGWNHGPLVKDINGSPIPDRSLIDVTSYKYSLKGRDATTVMTQRGCPFTCTFCCGRDIDMYKKTRSKSAERVVEELDYLNGEFGYDAFMWFDDEVNVNPKRLFEISKLLQQRDYIHRGFIRSDLLLRNPDTLDSLFDAGFVELCSGVESGSDEILGRINKGTTSAQNAEAAQMIMEKGITYKGFAIIGHPGETYADVEKTTDWIKTVQPDGFDISILSPLPGSRLYDKSVPSTKYSGFDRECQGLYFQEVDYSKASSFYKGKPGEYVCHVRTDELSDTDIVKLRDQIEDELRK